MTDHIKPCPFCGKDSTVVITQHDPLWFSIKCDVCDSSWADYTFEETKKRWNRRPDEEALAAMVTQLRSCGYECEAGKLEDNAAFRQLEEMVRFTK